MEVEGAYHLRYVIGGEKRSVRGENELDVGFRDPILLLGTVLHLKPPRMSIQ